MFCPICKWPTSLLKSLPLSSGMVRHERVCTLPPENAHPEAVFTTYELPAKALSGMWKRLDGALERAQRGAVKRAKAYERRAAVARLIGPMSEREIARLLGVSASTVHRAAKAHDASRRRP